MRSLLQLYEPCYSHPLEEDVWYMIDMGMLHMSQMLVLFWQLE